MTESLRVNDVTHGRPVISLVVVAAALGLSAALFWPATGLAWRWRRGLAASDRVEVEDALKHLWDGEYRQRPATLDSLAGTLGLAGRSAAELVDRLGRLGLLHHDDDALRLTPDGRREALRSSASTGCGNAIWPTRRVSTPASGTRTPSAANTARAISRPRRWRPRSDIHASIPMAIRFRCRAGKCRRIGACRSRSWLRTRPPRSCTSKTSPKRYSRRLSLPADARDARARARTLADSASGSRPRPMKWWWRRSSRPTSRCSCRASPRRHEHDPAVGDCSRGSRRTSWRSPPRAAAPSGGGCSTSGSSRDARRE